MSTSSLDTGLMHQRHVRDGRRRNGHTEDIEPRMRVGLKTHAARQQAPGDEKQRTEGHHAAGQHRGVDLHRAAQATTETVAETIPSVVSPCEKSTLPSDSSTAPTIDMPIAAKVHAEPRSRKKHIITTATTSGYMK